LVFAEYVLEKELTEEKSLELKRLVGNIFGGIMPVTDPIADMLTCIRNANIRFHEKVDVHVEY
jgi:hypothetical protein